MNIEKAIARFEKQVNYEFKDKSLLVQALTHSSYANEKKMKKEECNERLEFLGDAVLELVSSEYIYANNPGMPEGDMTKMRASFVCEPTLALCAKDIHLSEYLLLGKGEIITGGRERNSILSDAFEAVIGAVYLDGGFANAKEYIVNHVLKDIDKKQLFYDSKTILQEIVQSRYKEPLRYELIKEEGPDHNKTFMVAAYIGDKELASGTGKTKKAAEQSAAYEAILREQSTANTQDRNGDNICT